MDKTTEKLARRRLLACLRHSIARDIAARLSNTHLFRALGTNEVIIPRSFLDLIKGIRTDPTEIPEAPQVFVFNSPSGFGRTSLQHMDLAQRSSLADAFKALRLGRPPAIPGWAHANYRTFRDNHAERIALIVGRAAARSLGYTAVSVSPVVLKNTWARDGGVDFVLDLGFDVTSRRQIWQVTGGSRPGLNEMQGKDPVSFVANFRATSGRELRTSAIKAQLRVFPTLYDHPEPVDVVHALVGKSEPGGPHVMTEPVGGRGLRPRQMYTMTVHPMEVELDKSLETLPVDKLAFLLDNEPYQCRPIRLNRRPALSPLGSTGSQFDMRLPLRLR